MENKKWSEDFIAFIGNETGVLQQNLKKALDKWQLSPFEEETPKHLIELVNAKYQGGWYCEAFKEVRNDMEIIDNTFLNRPWLLYGWCKSFPFHYRAAMVDDKFDVCIKITKSEYLQLTGREPLQRDWTGVKYRHSTLNYHGDIIREEGIFYLIYIKEENKNIHITKKNVNQNFSSGTWIELKDEPAKESILEENVIIITIKDDDINLKATNIRPHELIGAMEMMLIRYKNKNLKL